MGRGSVAFLVLLACAAAPEGAYLPLDVGRRWTYEVRIEGYEPFVLATELKGGDVRDLDGAGRVFFPMVYGTRPGGDPDVTKSVYALAPDGPREFCFDALWWSVEHDPPIPLTRDAAWEGTVRLGSGAVETTARVRVEERGGELRATTTYAGAPLVIARTFRRGAGMTRFEARGIERPVSLRLAE